jgi:hypothetical protein
LDNIVDRPPAFLPLTDPIFDYGRSEGQVVTGGFVYRGAALGAAFRGRYFFADFGSRRIWSLALNINPSTGEATASALADHTDELGGSAALGNIASFGVDASGDLPVQLQRRGAPHQPGRAGTQSPSEHRPARARPVVTQPFVIAGWAFDAMPPTAPGSARSTSGRFPIPVRAPRHGSWRPQLATVRMSEPSSGASHFVGVRPFRVRPASRRLSALVVRVGGRLGTFGIVRPSTIVSNTLLAIDRPANFSTVNQPFHLAGWSIDTSAAANGVDTIHVWAYPITGGPPVFVGVPALGGDGPRRRRRMASRRRHPMVPQGGGGAPDWGEPVSDADYVECFA